MLGYNNNCYFPSLEISRVYKKYLSSFHWSDKLSALLSIEKHYLKYIKYVWNIKLTVLIIWFINFLILDSRTSIIFTVNGPRICEDIMYIALIA